MNETCPQTPAAPAADYVIYRSDAGDVFARSGRSGKVVAEGKDASPVIQKAIDALPAGGGAGEMIAETRRMLRQVLDEADATSSIAPTTGS